MSVPQSVINICENIPLDNRYDHTFYWENRDDQAAYFASKVVKTFTGYSYLRKSWDIKVAAVHSTTNTWNYLYFTNGGLTYYYFINDIEYIDDSTVKLFLELDVIQTYACLYNLLPCFVERQHVTNDSIGANLVEEGLELGEMVTKGLTEVQLGELCIMVLSSFELEGTGEGNFTPATPTTIHGIFSGLALYAIDLSLANQWGKNLQYFDEKGKSDGIVAMWMYPKQLVSIYDESWTGHLYHKVKNIVPFFNNIARPETLAGSYKPRNNKLYTYPYNFLYATNNDGTVAEYRYENFDDPSFCNFKIVGAISPEGGVRMYPLNYLNEQNAYEHGLSLGNYPTCAWNQDVYKLWLAQNQNQNRLTVITGAAKIAGGLALTALSGATGGLSGAASIGMIASGASQVLEHVTRVSDESVQPPQAKGQISSSLNIAAGFQCFTMKQKSIKPGMAAIIDDYFTMYGYKINRMQIPNPRARQNYTYVKTVGCKITGNIPKADMTKIEGIFDKGVTFWVGGVSIGNYGLSNNPV